MAPGSGPLVLLAAMVSVLTGDVLSLPTRERLTMISRGQMYVVNVGEYLVLGCEFETYSFNLFDNPVLWIKTQRDEDVQINIMSNIYKPFSHTQRFSVSFMPLLPSYKLELAIDKLQQEDSGNYTCEVRGPKTTILGSVTHQIFVRAHVKELYVSNSNDSALVGGVLQYNENEPGTLRCLSVGGYPPPDMAVYIGAVDITHHTTLHRSPQLYGVKGMRVMTYTTERSLHSFYALPLYDGRELRCVTTVMGLTSNVTLARLSVNYSPIVKCHRAQAYLGDRNVNLTCEVRAKPEATAIYWTIDQNGTTLANSEITDQSWVINMIPDQQPPVQGLTVTSLFLRRARKTSFHKYTLVAENFVGITTQEVDLIRLEHKTETRPRANSSQFISVSTPAPRRHGYWFISSAATSHNQSNCGHLVWILTLSAVLHFAS